MFNHNINKMKNKETDRGDTLHEQQYLKIGQYLSSSKGRAVFQEDGNFVIFEDSKLLWSTSTSGKNGTKLIMQDDGNLVIYDVYNDPIWASGTQYKG